MKQGRDFGKPKLDRLDVMRVLNISRTTLWRLVPQFRLGRSVRYDYDYVMRFKMPA